MKRLVPASAFAGLLASPLAAAPAAADIEIGAIHGHSGPFAAGGWPAAIGNTTAVDMIDEKGGVEGHKVYAR